MENITITCTNCGEVVSVDDVLTKQIQSKYKGQFEEEYKKKESVLRERALEFQKTLQQKEEELKNSQETIAKQVDEQVKNLALKIQKEAEQNAAKQINEEMKMLADQLKEKDGKLELARKAELEIRKEKNLLEEEKKSFELEKQRQLDAERESIKLETAKIIEQEHRLKDAEKDKKLQDAIKANEELRRKLEQGSQQTQGEVLELELETLLKSTFPYDEIIPVAKGINGADVLQKVRDRSGRECGIIAWESKATKTWSDAWVSKLKDDQRKAKAEIAVLISKALPSDINNFAQLDGIWVSNFDCLIPLANALRTNLMQVTNVRASMVGKNEKMEVIYNYLCGSEFKQRIEAIVEAFVTMQSELEKEKRAMQKMWSMREKQIGRVVENTTGMYGDLQGLIGSSMLSIEALELPSLEEEKVEVVEVTNTLL